MEAIKTIPLKSFEQMALARDVIRRETEALQKLADQLPAELPDAVEAILKCTGSLIVVGIGKAGWIGQKVSASFASTGTRSHFLHPSEAIHGDLGRVGDDDVLLIFSNSGETEEIVRLLPTFQKMDVPILAVTASPKSSLGKQARVTLDYGAVQEACHMGLAPTTSTTLMLALGDALALVTSEARKFTPQDFVKFHPGGSLGRKLSTVDEIMRPLSSCRVGNENDTVREILVSARQTGRRTGAILLTNGSGELSGLFTDSDLARLLEEQHDSALDQPIKNAMTQSPTTITLGNKTAYAIEILAARSISELPVINRNGQPVGMIDITDIVGLLPPTDKIE